jgi:small-conductance mechanosensitive channel
LSCRAGAREPKGVRFEEALMTRFGNLPAWVWNGTLSILVLGVSYLAGFLIKWVVSRRLMALAARTKGQWDEVLVHEFARRIPLWSFLLGVYLAAGFWTLSPNVDNALTKTLFVLIAVSLTFFSAAVVTKMTVLYGATFQQVLPITSLIQNIARGIVITMGMLIVLNGLGLSITPMLTALGVGGLAVALALQDTLSNLFAGVHVTIAGQIRVGDYVRLDSGEEGYVTDIGWRSTSICMLPNNLVLVPNAKLSRAIVTNYYLPDRELAVRVDVAVDYESDLAHVERVTCEVAKEILQSVPGGVAEFTPVVRYHTFDDTSINFTVILRAQEFRDQHLLKHEFIKRLHDRYRREAITIPSPDRTIGRRGRPGESPAKGST